MISFGVSAFLKIVSLNPKPRVTELRKRIFPLEGSDPYDFHRRLKLAVKKHLVDGVPLEALIEEAKTITPLPERKAMVQGLNKLGHWLEKDRALMTPYKAPSLVYESPRSLFKISFQPEFGLVKGRNNSVYQIWNTKTPELRIGAVYSTLALMAEEYETLDDGPPDFCILSLREPKAFYHSDPRASRYAASNSMIEWVEELILDIQSDDSGHKDIHDRHPAPWS